MRDQDRVLSGLRGGSQQLTAMLNTLLQTSTRKSARTDLRETLGRVGKIAAVRRAYVLGTSGIVSESSDPALSNTRGAEGLIAQIRRSGRAYEGVRRTHDGKAFVMGLTPVVAGPECIRSHHKGNRVGDYLGCLGLDMWAEEGLGRSAEQTRNTIIGALLIGGLVALTIGWVIRRRCGPLNLMASAADHLARGEVEQADIPAATSQDEIGRLARAFAPMAEGQREMAAAARSIARVI